MQFFNPREEIKKTRHKLSHWQQGKVPIFVTFRLADSLPQTLLDSWLAARDSFLVFNPKPWDEKVEATFHSLFSDKLDEYLDSGYGCCVLSDSRVSQIVAARLHYFDRLRYELESYVIMPNHVHVLFTPFDIDDLPNLIQAWKGVSSRMIHKANLSTLNPFWQPDYFDRLMRSTEHFEMIRSYIRENPVKAGLRKGFSWWERSE